ISSLRSTKSCPTRCSTWPRIGAGVLDQCAKPRLADATARFKSSAPERGKRPMMSFQSAGLRFSKYSPVEGTTQSPAMKFLNSGGEAMAFHGLGTKEWNRSFPVHARQQLATGQRETPDHQDDRQRVRDAQPAFPGTQRAPDSGDRHGRRANKIEDEFEPAGVRVRPDEHADAQTDPKPHTEPGREPRASPCRAGRMQSARASDTAEPGTRRDRYRRHAAAQRRLGVRQLREQLVHLAHLAIPVALFGILLFHVAPPVSPAPAAPPSPPRANPYRSIFL